ncbi:MAG TPA: hypothetical protein VFC78_05985, partial [Tepidisphaeraceae bacterium]|nr:hypothetical protein [Tepidisphaeraceae bacterium]
DAAACAHGTAVAAIPCLLSTLSLGSLEPIRVNLPYPGRLWRDARVTIEGSFRGLTPVWLCHG